MKVLTVLGRRYPDNLRTIHDRPPILFVRGELIPGDARSIAIVGTRRPTQQGVETAQSIVRDVASTGYAIVSGLAQGIDTAAHVTTLESGGRTVAVIGTGLRRSYPATNADLQSRLARESAVISQFWPDQPPTQKTFPMRNVVMSGFAVATVVVEASDTSGARMQARFALGHGRAVCLQRRVLGHDCAQHYAQVP